MGTAAVPVSGRVVSTQADGIVVQAPAVLAVEVPATGDTQTITATALPDASVQVGLMRDEPKPVPDRLPRLVLGQHERTHALRAARRQVAQATSRTRAEVLSKQVDAMIARGSVDSTPPKDSLSELMPYRLSAAEILNEATPARRATLATLVREHAAWKTPPPPERRAALAHTALLAFAERAWRGPLSADDRAFLGRVLGTAQKESLGDSGALHRALTVVLVSPRFLYRLQRSQGSEAPYALGEFELASRLSFALWASLPDAQLLRLAGEGRLHQPEVIRAEAARMLADPRAAVLAREFGGIWLGYAGFDQLNEVDQQRFPMFTPALRQAMYDEVVLFIDHLLRGEAPVTDIIDARYTWLNEALAKHYDIDGVTGSAMRRVDLPKDSPRGGVMGMAAILTKTAKPLRTSPVLRGDWVLERLLGIDIPPPPANVAMLSDDERDAKGRTLLEQLRVHRDNPACSSCHAKLDPLGLALENYDPIGRWRDQDLNGGPLFTEGAMPDGSVLRGVPGLRAHVQAKRDSVLDGLCRKTVGWFLGRACLPSDRELVARMRAALTANGNRFPAIVAEVVTSQQFLKRRDDLGQEAKP
jgi:hypothetical protein